MSDQFKLFALFRAIKPRKRSPAFRERSLPRCEEKLRYQAPHRQQLPMDELRRRTNEKILFAQTKGSNSENTGFGGWVDENGTMQFAQSVTLDLTPSDIAAQY